MRVLMQAVTKKRMLFTWQFYNVLLLKGKVSCKRLHN